MTEPINGRHALSEEEILLINRIKDTKRDVGVLWREVSQNPNVDQRWLAIAKTHIQEGFMALVRAVTKPEDLF